MIRTTIMSFEINPAPPIDDTLRRPSVLPEIKVLVNDPDAPVAEVVRLITIEITNIAAATRTCTERRAPFIRNEILHESEKNPSSAFRDCSQDIRPIET